MSLLPVLIAAVLTTLLLVALFPEMRALSAHAGQRSPNGVERDAVSAGHAGVNTHELRAAPIARLTAENTVLSFPGPPVQATAAYLVDVETGRVLFQKNARARLPMASTTKITTAVLTLQRARLSDLVTVSKAAATVGESTMSLQKGERLSVLDLLHGMMLNSGNDAAVALAEHVGGTQTHFVSMMNGLARALHMRSTHYTNPHGLDAPGQYTSARDLATIALYALRDPTFRKIVATANYHIPKTRHNREHWLGNINRALFWYPGVDGVKPGGTDAAGLCQVVTARRNGRHVMAVLLHTPNLATDLRNLLDTGTRDFEWVPSIYALDQPSTSVSGGSGIHAWRYFYGAGHYVSGPFLSYFNTHGGLQTLGYPRTEQVQDGDGRIDQYFQNAELVYDPAHHSVYPEALGAILAPKSSSVARSGSHKVARALRALYRRLGGAGVFGAPVTGTVLVRGTTVQFFQYGEMATVRGSATLVPTGDVALRLRGLLPAKGVGNTFLPTMDPALEAP